MYAIGFHGCSHLGYRMGSMNRSHTDGINLRENDGYVAHRMIYSEMLDAGVIGIVDGGDLFHVEHPSVRAVAEAISADDMRVAAGKRWGTPIWRRTNGGNHDNGASTHVSAVSHIERAELESLAVFPDSPHPIGPHPGLYEVHQPDADRDLFLHFVSHNGLDPALGDKGIVIDPKPVSGAVNIFVAHGIFEADGRLFGAVDGHGAQRVIPVEWTNRAWSAVILSDYHTLGPIPGFGPDDDHAGPDVWMTGSGVRRGFSDEDAGRGWIEVRVDDDGHTSVIPHYIWQRPQIDFEPIDARGKSVSDIDRIVRQRLGDVTLSDGATETLPAMVASSSDKSSTTQPKPSDKHWLPVRKIGEQWPPMRHTGQPLMRTHSRRGRQWPTVYPPQTSLVSISPMSSLRAVRAAAPLQPH